MGIGGCGCVGVGEGVVLVRERGCNMYLGVYVCERRDYVRGYAHVCVSACVCIFFNYSP